MNEHLKPVFEVVIPAIKNAGIPYWVYGGVAIAGINETYLRVHPDVDVFVMDDDYDKTTDLVTRLEKELNWDHADARRQRGRPKREWYVIGKLPRRDIFSVVAVYRNGERIRFVFRHDLVPDSILTSEARRINGYSFVSPSIELIKELLIDKSNEKRLTRHRRKKLKIDAKVLMPEDEYHQFCARLDSSDK
jgi:hypothetical protein